MSHSNKNPLSLFADLLVSFFNLRSFIKTKKLRDVSFNSFVKVLVTILLLNLLIENTLLGGVSVILLVILLVTSFEQIGAKKKNGWYMLIIFVGSILLFSFFSLALYGF
jgi:hypothetical protein